MVRILSKIGVITGAVLIVMLTVTALFANILTEHNPIATNIQEQLSPPSRQHPYGTDNMGRDNQTRVFHGFRTTLGASSLSVLTALILGGALGLLAGGCGSTIYRAIILLARFLSAGPGILLILAIAYRWGSPALHMALGIPIVLIPGFIRVFSGLMLCKKDNNAKKLFGVVIAQISLGMAMAVLVCAGLGFIGLGAQPPTPEFGTMLASGIMYFRNAPWLVAYPGFALAVAALSFCILGESLNALLLAGESNGNITDLKEPGYQAIAE